MAERFATIQPDLAEWWAAQPMFFVATAPSEGGHVNLSPKGHDTLRVLSPTRVAYLDLTGSGIETVAHVRENGRITLMFCAFDGPARIIRLSGRGSVVTCDDAEFEALAAQFNRLPGERAVITVDVDRVADSCGYGVPRMELIEQRDRLLTALAAKGDAGLEAYREDRNATSIDGLRGY
jgi:hypothetical protein